jgi:hypothetical protein
MAARVREAASQTARITTATTTQVKAKSGVLHRVLVEVTTAFTITFNDALGTKFVFPASIPVGLYPIEAEFAGKIEVVTAGASNLTCFFE